MSFFFRLLKREFILTMKTSYDIVPIFSLLLVLFSLLHFLGSIQPGEISTLIWIFLCLLVSQGSQSLFREDFESGLLEVVYSSSPYLGTFLGTKVLSYLLFMLINILLSGYFLCLLGVIPYTFLLATACAIPGLVVTVSLVSALMLKGNSNEIRLLISIPLLLPFLILGIVATNDHEMIYFAVKTLLGLSLSTVPLGFFGSKLIVSDKIKQP